MIQFIFPDPINKFPFQAFILHFQLSQFQIHPINVLVAEYLFDASQRHII